MEAVAERALRAPEVTTFADLGKPFALFEAPIEEATGFDSQGHCSVCLYLPKATFKLGAGAGIVVRCRACRAPRLLDADLQEDVHCYACGYPVRFPRLEELWDFIGKKRKQTVITCCDCLHTGRTAINKLTEYGVVTWESAIEGLIDWVPEGASCPMRIVRLAPGRNGARVPGRALFDLVCTPMYRSWTTPVWLFCCGAPMTYVGAWSRRQFQSASPGDGKSLLARVLNDHRPGIADALWHHGFGYDPRVYVFRCRRCGRLRANWDRNPAYTREPRHV